LASDADDVGVEHVTRVEAARRRAEDDALGEQRPKLAAHRRPVREGEPGSERERG
jgi:hypothetical protein